MIAYEIREADNRFWVGHEDGNGEWWDADLEGFASLEEAEKFLKVCEEQEGSEETEMNENKSSIENDLRIKIQGMMQQINAQLDAQLTKLIESGCGIVDDHEQAGQNYVVPKAFIEAFLKDQAEDMASARHLPIYRRSRKLIKNYRHFL